MSDCVHCGKPTPDHSNYCDWDCHVAQAVAAGGKVIAPNGLPIRSIGFDGTMREDSHADHPDYLFPVHVECHDPDVHEYEYPQQQALIYSDGCVAVTLYEYCYCLWSLGDGGWIGGGYQRKNAKLTEASRLKVRALTPRCAECDVLEYQGHQNGCSHKPACKWCDGPHNVHTPTCPLITGKP